MIGEREAAYTPHQQQNSSGHCYIMSWQQQERQFFGNGGHNFVRGYYQPQYFNFNTNPASTSASASSISDVTASTTTTASTITASTTSTSNSSSRRKRLTKVFQIPSKNFTEIKMADGTIKVISWQSVVKTDSKTFNPTLAKLMCVSRMQEGYFYAWSDNDEERKRGLEYLEGKAEPTEEDIKNFQTKARNK